MEEKELHNILTQLADHEKRLKKLEGAKLPLTPSKTTVPESRQRTLREIIKGKRFKNGQEQLAAIVGYHEVVLGKPINKADFEKEWDAAKMLNKYNGEYLRRAKDEYFRVGSNDICVLTQTGENFFEDLLNNNQKPNV